MGLGKFYVFRQILVMQGPHGRSSPYMPKNLFHMRQFTESEKQQLRIKIRDRQERRVKPSESESRREKYAVLIFGLIPLALIVISFLIFRRIGHELFYTLVITVIALLDHIADYFAKRGWKRRLLKIAEWVFIVLAFSYVAYQLWIRFGSKLTFIL